MPEYQGRVRLRLRPYPLELLGGEAAPRDVLQQEWWLGALQEPAAEFKPWAGDDWPSTTLPAFDAAWAAFQQGEPAGFAYDLRVRRAFFAQSRNIGRREVLLEIASEAGLDMARFRADFESGKARPVVLDEFQLGRERYHVRGTPTLMRPDGSQLEPPLAEPIMRHRKVVAVQPLPCCGEACLEATRALLEQAAQDGRHPAAAGAEEGDRR
jgi:predicted DsbA family dithiol-disulfide isomerase